MQKQIIVIGDIEMGGGTLTDDFISDNALSTLLRKIAKRKPAIDLILNGDTFDFLKCPLIKDGKKSYPRHITDDISLSKLDMIYTAHKPVFEALKEFCTYRKNRVFFIIGNHDHDLFFKSVQRKIKRLCGRHRDIYFRMKYRYHRVYAEHGHQYDFLNKINPKNVFIKHKGRRILNFPWVSFTLIGGFMSMKEEHPFLERILPRPLLFSEHKQIIKKINMSTLKHALKSIFYYPLRYFYDPTHFLPRNILKEFYQRLKRRNWDVDPIVGKFKWKQRRLIKSHKVLVLGHDHTRHVEEKNGGVILHPDTWRDEYTFDKESRTLIPKEKSYVQIDVNDDGYVSWEVVDYPVKRKTLKFDDVVKDEMKYINQAAKLEKYKPNIHEVFTKK